MGVYSHSKLSLFETCPEAYKIKYIDKTFPDLPVKIQLHLGSIVHSALEWLYTEAKNRKIELDELIEYYANKWNEEFSESIVVVNGTKEEHFNKGLKFLADYYLAHIPFKDNTIALEKQIRFKLDEENSILGYIDRIVKNAENEYEVHDYKTSANAKSQKEADADRQLAFYHLGLIEELGKDIKVKLVWHFLAHKSKVFSSRTIEELEKLKQDTLKLIKKIETNRDWSACNLPWCDWCSYKKTNLSKNNFAMKRDFKQKDLRNFF